MPGRPEGAGLLIPTGCNRGCAGRAAQRGCRNGRDRGVNGGTMAERIGVKALVALLAGRAQAGRIIVAIAGAPGSGKSTLAEAVEAALNAEAPGCAAVLPMDGFHYDDLLLVPMGKRPRKGAPDTFDVGGLYHMLQRLRANDEAAVAEATSKLGVLAPAGLSALEAARAAAQAVVDENAHASGREAGDVAALDVNVKGLEQSLASHRDAVAAAERELGLLDASIARLEAQVGSDQKQLAALAEGLPGPDDRRAAGETLAEADVTSAKELAEAVREKSAWSEAAPQGSAYEALLASSRRAASAVTELADRQAKLDRDVAELEGALRRDSEDGVGAEIAGLEEELAVAARRLEELQRDADALQLLASRLERFGEDHRDRVLRPLVDRLEPLLSKLIPDAKLAMDGPLLAVRLDRPGLTDPVQRVSGGTREQIATLVRIAHADLMASRGVELPLVLDDALVFSDDRRLEIMVGLLAEAAKRHQVIVLSCHQRALDPLFAACGANRLEMSAWGEVKAVGSRSEGGRGDPRSQKSRAVGPAFEITQ